LDVNQLMKTRISASHILQANKISWCAQSRLRETERHTDRQTETETHRQTDRESAREREREREKETSNKPQTIQSLQSTF